MQMQRREEQSAAHHWNAFDVSQQLGEHVHDSEAPQAQREEGCAEVFIRDSGSRPRQEACHAWFEDGRSGEKGERADGDSSSSAT